MYEKYPSEYPLALALSPLFLLLLLSFTWSIEELSVNTQQKFLNKIENLFSLIFKYKHERRKYIFKYKHERRKY